MPKMYKNTGRSWWVIAHVEKLHVENQGIKQGQLFPEECGQIKDHCDEQLQPNCLKMSDP